MERTLRKKEAEYYTVLSVLEKVRFIKISTSDTGFRRVGFSDIILDKKLLDDAIAFCETGSVSRRLVSDIIGPLLATELHEEVSRDDRTALFSALEADAETPENGRIANLLNAYHTGRNYFRDLVGVRLQITKAVLDMFCETPAVAKFAFLPPMLVQTNMRTLNLYCRSQDRYDAVHELAEHFLQQQLQLRKTPNASQRSIQTLHLEKLDSEELVSVFERTIETFERKYRSEQRFKQEAKLLTRGEPTATRRDIRLWMANLKRQGTVEYAPDFISDPIFGRVLRYAESEMGVKIFGTSKFPFHFEYKTSSDDNDTYNLEVARLKRKIQELTAPPAKRRSRAVSPE